MMRIGFPIGIALIVVGYAFFYSGYSNLATDGHGTSVLQGLTGHEVGVNTPGDAIVPNLSGNTPQTGGAPGVEYA